MSDKVQKNSFTIKDQGKVDYATGKPCKVSAKSQPGMGKGQSRGGGAALRGTKFEGVY